MRLRDKGVNEGNKNWHGRGVGKTKIFKRLCTGWEVKVAMIMKSQTWAMLGSIGVRAWCTIRTAFALFRSSTRRRPLFGPSVRLLLKLCLCSSALLSAGAVRAITSARCFKRVYVRTKMRLKVSVNENNSGPVLGSSSEQSVRFCLWNMIT